MTSNRLVVVDTETTGLYVENGERVIEIACVEIHDLATIETLFHTNLNPEKEIEQEAVRIHGKTWADLRDEPKFVEIVDDFLAAIQDADVVMHQAEFDRKFIDHELELSGSNSRMQDVCNIIDSLALAREKYQEAHNDLGALCKRLKVDLSSRELHGALIDAELLARVYIRMVSGEHELFDNDVRGESTKTPTRLSASFLKNRKPVVVYATDEELKSHEVYMKKISENNV